MKSRILFSMILVLALAFCAVPVSAYLSDDVWIDKGIRTNTAINGNSTAASRSIIIIIPGTTRG
jgi:hypothetical protein